MHSLRIKTSTKFHRQYSFSPEKHIPSLSRLSCTLEWKKKFVIYYIHRPIYFIPVFYRKRYKTKMSNIAAWLKLSSYPGRHGFLFCSYDGMCRKILKHFPYFCFSVPEKQFIISHDHFYPNHSSSLLITYFADKELFRKQTYRSQNQGQNH